MKNGRGDLVVLTDSTGNPVATYTYDSWGNLISSTDPNGTGITASNPYRYADYRYDSVSGLYFLMARWDDPSIGRFLSADPIEMVPGYTYAGNSPISFYDPTGYKEMTDDAGAYIDEADFEKITGDDAKEFGSSSSESSAEEPASPTVRAIPDPYYDADSATVSALTREAVSEGTGEGATVKAESTVKNNPLNNTQYTDKVKAQMNRGPGEHHSFPTVVDNYGSLGEQTSVIGGDGIMRTKIEIPGAYNGKLGVFQYIRTRWNNRESSTVCSMINRRIELTVDHTHSHGMPIDLPSDLLDMAYDLRNIGVAEMAWRHPAILNVIQFITYNGYALLGGDVYLVSERGISATGDSWFINKQAGVPVQEFVNESRDKAIDYVSSYEGRNGNNFLYSVVVAE